MRKGKGDPEEFLNKLFGSVTRARILCILCALPEQSFYQREIMNETGLSLRPVQRELNNLLWLGIIKKQVTRNRVYPPTQKTTPACRNFYREKAPAWHSGVQARGSARG